jgi:hypothetical protein
LKKFLANESIELGHGLVLHVSHDFRMMREGRFFYGLSDEEPPFYQKKIRLTTDETRSHLFSCVSI